MTGVFRNELVKYDPKVILHMCSRLSADLDKRGQTVDVKPWITRKGMFAHRAQLVISHDKLAFLAMLTLRNYPFAHLDRPSDREFLRLVNNATYGADDPALKADLRDKAGLVKLIVRLMYQQWPLQEDVYHALPRHLLLYLGTDVQVVNLNPDTVFREKLGLSILDYITIGLTFYSAALDKHTFGREYIENTRVISLQQYLQPVKVEKFLATAGATYEDFRMLCLREEKLSPEAGPYRFNPLFDRPVIVGKDGLLCVPIPRLVMYTVTKGLYYDLLDQFSSSTGNTFSDWFGHAFEQYGGLVLRDAFGDECIFHEPKYGIPEVGGPDWVVVRNGTAFAFEFRSGRLSKKAKTYADYEEILMLIRRNVVDTLAKLPQKIEDLKAGKTGIPLDGVQRYIPCVVTYEPLYPHSLFLDLIDQELAEEGVTAFDFEVMSIEDLEWLLAWGEYQDPVDFIFDKWANQDVRRNSVRHVVDIKIRENNVQKLRNRLLERTADQYWENALPSLHSTN